MLVERFPAPGVGTARGILTPAGFLDIGIDGAGEECSGIPPIAGSAPTDLSRPCSGVRRFIFVSRS